MNTEQAAENALEYLREFSNQPLRYRLVLLVGENDRKRSAVVNEIVKRVALPVLDVGLELSRELLSVPEGQRPLEASSAFQRLVQQRARDGSLVADNLGFLFEPSLQLRVLDLLEDTARFTTLIASWPGTVQFRDDGTVSTLSHAGPESPEYAVWSHVQTPAVLDLNGEG